MEMDFSSQSCKIKIGSIVLCIEHAMPSHLSSNILQGVEFFNKSHFRIPFILMNVDNVILQPHMQKFCKKIPK